MKIAYFLDISKGLGGAGNLILRQAKLMSSLYAVIVVIPCNKQGIPNYEYIARCEKMNLSYAVIEFDTSFNMYEIDVLSAVESVPLIEELVRRQNITFLHSVQLNLAVEIVSRKMQIPHLMDIYQLNEDEFKVKYGDIFPQYHLCDSDMYSKLWERNLGLESRCIRPIALLEKIRVKEKKVKNKFKILMLGSVCNRKNQLVAIQAVEKCLEVYDLELVIAGDIDNQYAKQCKEYVEYKGLEQNVVFKGFVSDVSELLEQADCFLCSSTEESFPSSIVEAVTYDLTIITTPVAGVPEVFCDNYNAFVSRDFSLESLVKCIIECCEAYVNQTIAHIHDNARCTWNDMFAPSVIRKQLDEYYKYIEKKFMPKRNQISNIYCNAQEVSSKIAYLYEGNKWLQKRCAYFGFLKNTLKKGKAYIWGAGEWGRIAYELIRALEFNIEIVAFVDKNRRGRYFDIPIISPDEIQPQKVDYVLLSFVGDKVDVIYYLKLLGMEYNKSVWLVP